MLIHGRVAQHAATKNFDAHFFSKEQLVFYIVLLCFAHRYFVWQRGSHPTLGDSWNPEDNRITRSRHTNDLLPHHFTADLVSRIPCQVAPAHHLHPIVMAVGLVCLDSTRLHAWPAKSSGEMVPHRPCVSSLAG